MSNFALGFNLTYNYKVNWWDVLVSNCPVMLYNKHSPKSQCLLHKQHASFSCARGSSAGSSGTTARLGSRHGSGSAFSLALILGPWQKGQQLPGMFASCGVTGPRDVLPTSEASRTASAHRTSAKTPLAKRGAWPWPWAWPVRGAREGYSTSGGRAVNISEITQCVGYQETWRLKNSYFPRSSRVSRSFL